MARILVQLKLRLLLGALRATNATRASFILSSTVALIVAIGTFAGLAALRHNGAAADLTAVIYTLFAFGWVILPLIAFGIDSTLDPTRSGSRLSSRAAPSTAPCWPGRASRSARGLADGKLPELFQLAARSKL